jgi:hypothetical protein
MWTVVFFSLVQEEVLPTVARRFVWSRNLVDEEAAEPDGIIKLVVFYWEHGVSVRREQVLKWHLAM